MIKASDGPPTWQAFLLSHAADDLLMVVGSQRLYYDRQPIHLHWLDRVSLLLIRQAYVFQQSLALCYPVPVCNLPMLAAAQLLIHDFVQNYPGNLSVLLISPRTEVRQHYLNLMVGREPLACALPLARIRADGDPAIIPVPGKTTRKVPRLYHLSRAHLLDAPWPRGIGAIIVDHASGSFCEKATHIHELATRRRIPTVINLCTDPFALFLEELTGASVPVWVWDHHGLAADFGEQIATGDGNARHPFGVSIRQFQNIGAGIQHHTLVCRHPVLEAAARRLWDDLGTVQRAFSGRAGLGIRRAIRAAYGTFYTILQMLVPLPVYEEEARNLWGIRTISRRIADLEAFTSVLRAESPDLAEVYWPSLILDLKEMQDALGAGNPKYDTLVRQIHEHQAQQKRLAIVCPNRATKRMLQLCLRAREGLRLGDLTGQNDDRPLRLLTYKELNTLESSDTLLFPGQFSYGRRQYMLTAAAPETYYLAYGDESDRIEQQVAAFHQALAEMADAEKRERAWVALAPFSSDGQLPGAASQVATPAIEFTRSEGEQVSRRTVTATRGPTLSFWTPFSTPEYDLVRGQDILSSDSEEALRPSEFAAPSRQSVLVPALRIEFADGFCYAEPDSRMTVFLPATDRTDDRRADGLRPEDIVIFVDGDQRRQLYEAVLERIEHHPAMGATYILVRYWQQAVREGFFRSGMTCDELLRKLQARGCQRETPQTVRSWITGQVRGPLDLEDIRRVGEVFEDEALTQEWKEIGKALRRIWGLHIALARKLNRVIAQAGLKGQRPDASEECIDRELNLYLDDFRDSVTVHRVTAISLETTPVPYVLTGRFFERGMELKW
jgi:hypothetical protein